MIGIKGTGHVRLTGIIGNESLLMNELIDTGSVSSVAGTGDLACTVKDILNTQQDIIIMIMGVCNGVVLDIVTAERFFIAQKESGNFDTIVETGNGCMGPT